jgi:hypothetical protein
MSYLAFNLRPSVVIPDHRPLYKITQLLLVLMFASHGKKSTVVRLQLFNWILKDSARRTKLSQASVTKSLQFPAWGLDPTLDTALTLAKADGLIESSSTGVKLTVHGQGFCTRALKAGLFEEDEQYLKKIGLSITEKMVTTIVERWI